MSLHRRMEPRPLRGKKSDGKIRKKMEDMTDRTKQTGNQIEWKIQLEYMFLAAFGVGIIGILFRMDPVCIAIAALFAVAMVPGVLRNSNLSREEKQRFFDVAIYMEQMLYSFRKQKKILMALEDVEPLFRQGRMKEILLEAKKEILYDFTGEIPNQNGLDVVEKEYDCQRLKAMHRFMMKVEQIGGDFDDSIELLLNDRNMWVERTSELQKERDRSRRNIIISIFMSILICVSTFYFMPKDIDITEFKITSISTMLLLINCMLVFRKADGKLAVNWLKLDHENQDKNMIRQYERMAHYDGKKEQKKSLLYALIPLGFFFLALFLKSIPGMLLAGCVTIFAAQQHKIGHYLNCKRVIREVEMAFPQWLMEIALLLQGDNVQVSIHKTYDNAPMILKPELEIMMEKLEKNPESQKPYLEFLELVELPAIQSAMKMLYSISSGHGGDVSEQIKEIIHRNNLLMDKAEKLENEDRMAGTNLYFLLPMLLGAFKLILDLSVFMLAFLQTSY